MRDFYYDPKNKAVKRGALSASDFTEEKDDKRFHIGQRYEGKVVDTLYCKSCGGDQFNVGIGDLYTAIKCITCEWEVCVHEG